MHSHPVPLLGQIESGELTLAEKTGIKKTFKEVHIHLCFSQQILLFIQWLIVKSILRQLCGF